MKPDKDRRRYKRYKHASEFQVSLGDRSFNAYTINYSLGGLCFSAKGIPPINPGSIINLKIKDLRLDIQGRVVWIKKVVNDIRVGIERTSIFGLLKHFPISDILLDLQRSEKTGVLEVRNSPIFKRIYIKNGDMIFAASNQEEDRLGEVLLKAGRITLEQYHQSVDVMKETGKRQGTVFVELGYLKPKELIWAVTHQVEKIILSLFQWEDGEFEFIEGPLPSNEVITLKISAANLIYRGTKGINKLTYIKNICPPMDTILYYSADPMDLFQDITLEVKDKEILSLIDGSRRMKDILSLSPLDNFQTLKTIYALLSARIIEVKEKVHTEDKIHEEILREPEVKLDSAFVEKVEELYSKINSSDYYDILGIPKWAATDEIKRTYYKKAKEFHPDRHFSLPSETLKSKLNTIFSYLTLAYKTLSDLKTKGEYDRGLSTRTAPVEDRGSEIARVRFEEGKVALKRKAYADAVELFGQAVYLDSSVADYHFYFAVALGKQKKFREAEDAINKAIKLDPFNADYMTELGQIYLELGFKSRAKAIFEKAIKFDPSNEKAAECLQKAGGSS